MPQVWPIYTYPDRVAGDGSGNRLLLAAIRGRKEGHLEWWRIGIDLSSIFRKLRNIRLELAGPFTWGLNAAKNASILAYLYAHR